MSKRAQELEQRNIMQGLEELATFMSFRSSTTGLRILSVETTEQYQQSKAVRHSADILDLQQHANNKQQTAKQVLKKSLSFTDRIIQ